MAIGDLVTEDWGFEYRGFAFGGTSDFLIAPGVTGLVDNPDVQVTDQRRIRRHGLAPGDDFMAGRDIVIPIEVTATSSAQWATNLQALKTAFDVDPARGEDPLVFQVPGVAGGGKRRVNARPRGFAAPLDLDWFYEIPIVTVRFSCTSPDILDNTLSSTTSPILAGGAEGAPWPFEWPLSWGTLIATSFTVTNTGTRAAQWTATIPGPVTNPRIAHVGTGRALDLTIDIPTGQTLTIDSAARTVLLDGSNRYSTLAPGSAWFDLAPGANELSYQADAGTGQLTISHRSTWG